MNEYLWDIDLFNMLALFIGPRNNFVYIVGK